MLAEVVNPFLALWDGIQEVCHNLRLLLFIVLLGIKAILTGAAM